MKELLMLAAAVAAILPMTAQAAESAEGAIALNSIASNTCAIRGITAGRGPAGVVTTGPFTNTTGGVASATATLNFNNELMDQTTAFTKALEKDLMLNAFCNYADHTVSLKSANGGLTNGAPTPTVGTFNRRINYTARVRDWAPTGRVAELVTNGTLTESGTSSESAFTLVGPAINKTGASIRINTLPDSSAPLLAGAYSDVLTVKLGAAFAP
jgi:hypothetical protein